MKTIIIILCLILFKNGFSQINVSDLGEKSFYQVREAFAIVPCEVTDNLMITYCVEDGSRLSFLFQNEVLNGIMTMTAYSSQYAAEKDLESIIKREQYALGIVPFKSNGATIFNTLESSIYISYTVEYTNQNYYLTHYIAKK